jgi:hypothetical protein
MSEWVKWLNELSRHREGRKLTRGKKGLGWREFEARLRRQYHASDMKQNVC